MATLNYDHDYINMEVQDSSFSAMFVQSNNEFEFQFQSVSISSEKDQHAMTSPADELFYMGTLLPLHLPPRLDMVQKILLQHNNFDTKAKLLEESFASPLKSTPLQSCNISPSDSCLECSVSFTKEKKPLAKKLMKWPNLKSLFTKSGGCADITGNDEGNKLPTPKHSSSTNAINTFGQIKYNKVSSFPGAFSGESESKNTCVGSNVYKRSNSLLRSELENPIQAAIAHCKRLR